MLFNHKSQSNSQITTPLLDALKKEILRSTSPFYTPGHKQGKGISQKIANLMSRQVFQYDLPDLPGLNLYAADSAIALAQNLAAETFGADRTWFLVNGSTCGIMAAIAATCNPGDKIILSRNIHQSAINGLIVSGARPIFVLPEYDRARDLTHCVAPETISAALEQHQDAKAVLIVSPTYHGVCADLAEIARRIRPYNLPLIVDEAHGAHFAFHPELPASALELGADLVVQSTHKTLSAMTQASMLHLKGDRVDAKRVERSLQLLQSTSPSSLLLASLDAAREQMASEGRSLMEGTLQLADKARSLLGQIPKLATLNTEQAGAPGFFALDRTRLTVDVSTLGINGFAADEIFYKHLGVTAELPTLRHLTFAIALGNTQTDIERLVAAFKRLASEYGLANAPISAIETSLQLPPSISSLSVRDAFFAPTETVTIEDAIGRISAEIVCPYPPGIPLLLPGEEISAIAIATLESIFKAGGFISGCSDESLQTLRVVCR
jgi:arginine decarboxylase